MDVRQIGGKPTQVNGQIIRLSQPVDDSLFSRDKRTGTPLG
ncbi:MULTISPECIES: hypothetical protein [unclassified Synechococcus]|nr:MULTISPECIES: hypothetical protein [unclassified Synechococcus]